MQSCFVGEWRERARLEARKPIRGSPGWPQERDHSGLNTHCCPFQPTPPPIMLPRGVQWGGFWPWGLPEPLPCGCGPSSSPAFMQICLGLRNFGLTERRKAKFQKVLKQGRKWGCSFKVPLAMGVYQGRAFQGRRHLNCCLGPQ